METPKKFEKTRLSLLNEGCKVNVVADKAAGIAKRLQEQGRTTWLQVAGGEPVSCAVRNGLYVNAPEGRRLRCA